MRLVIGDFSRSQVRLARLDATDTATVAGLYDGIVDDHVIVLNGTTLEAISRSGAVTKLGQLAATPDWLGAGTVTVNPQLSQWLYSIRDDAANTHVHLGTPAGDTVIATLPSPNGNAYYQPFAWNATGVYMVVEPVGIGGAGPFLDYHFNAARFDPGTAHVAVVSPNCPLFQVLDDGTMLCRASNPLGSLDVRSPSGHTTLIQMTIGTTGDDAAFIRVMASPDGSRVIAGRDGKQDPVINYQMAVAALTGSTASAFGPLDYLPDAWLPDGRVVADHMCTLTDWGGGPCDASQNGTYFFSADGSTRTLFFKLTSGAVVGYI